MKTYRQTNAYRKTEREIVQTMLKLLYHVIVVIIALKWLYHAIAAKPH